MRRWGSIVGVAVCVVGSCILPEAQKSAGPIAGGAGGSGGDGAGGGGAGASDPCDPGVCELAGGACTGGACTFSCESPPAGGGGAGGDASCAAVDCPAGMPCHILCNGPGSCPNLLGCPAGVPACHIECTGGACLQVDCAAESCLLECTGGSCGRVTCDLAGDCTVNCEVGSCAAGVACTSYNSCQILCDDSCPSVDAWSDGWTTIACIATHTSGACGSVTCGGGSCYVECGAGSACDTVDCSQAPCCATSGCPSGVGGGAGTGPSCAALSCHDDGNCRMNGNCTDAGACVCP
ncbi:MAG: hypothetical protein IT373_34945 [Polyangiaceae bacterium]|nr:hypothetical protein [Polyangiaceae bacterium]